MKEPLLKEEITWKGDRYELELFDDINFTKISPITQVYGFVFNKNHKLLIIKCKDNDWCLPGGTPEIQDKNWKETLIREVDEEANVDIKKIIPIGYIKSKAIDNDPKSKKGYALRAVSHLKKVKERAIDPATGEINEIKFIDPSEFLEYCKWGENGKAQLEMALKTINLIKI